MNGLYPRWIADSTIYPEWLGLGASTDHIYARIGEVLSAQATAALSTAGILFAISGGSVSASILQSNTQFTIASSRDASTCISSEMASAIVSAESLATTGSASVQVVVSKSEITEGVTSPGMSGNTISAAIDGGVE